MKRSALPLALSAIVALLFLGSCTKEQDEKDPGIVICYFEPYLPVRVINTNGEDLLSPGQLASGTVEINWNTPGGNMKPVKMTPAVFSKQGQPDQYYFSIPMGNIEKGLTIAFSLKNGESDILYIKGASSSSKPFGVTEITFNGSRVDPQMLFGSTVYGLQLVKTVAGK